MCWAIQVNLEHQDYWDYVVNSNFHLPGGGPGFSFSDPSDLALHFHEGAIGMEGTGRI